MGTQFVPCVEFAERNRKKTGSHRGRSGRVLGVGEVVYGFYRVFCVGYLSEPKKKLCLVTLTVLPSCWLGKLPFEITGLQS